MAQAQTAKASGSKRKGAKKKTTPVKKWTPKVEGYLVDNDGVMHELTTQSAKALRGNVEPSMTTGDEKLPVWTTDKGGDRYTTSGMPKVNDCVYRAVKKFVESLGLGTLTTGDEKFFRTHPRVNGDGVNKANVLAVSHGLVVPWGLGITRVWVPKMSSLGEQHLEFAKALGVNPMALATYDYSNEDLITELGLDKYSEDAATIRDTFRFEFVDEPAGPCVVMLSNWTGGKSSTTVKTGGANISGKWSSTTHGMGHADFVGPRDGLYGNWQIAFQIGRLPTYADNSINRYQEVSEAFTPEEIAAKKNSHRTFSVWQSIVDGKSLNEWDRGSKTVQYPSTYTPAATKPKGGNGAAASSTAAIITKAGGSVSACPDCKGMVAEVDGVKYCLACDWYEDAEEEAAGVSIEEICPICYTKVFADTKKCKNETCNYDPKDWQVSDYFVCKEHGYALEFHKFKRLGDRGEFVYVCGECLFASGMSLVEYMEKGMTHPYGKSTQIKEFPKDKKEADDGGLHHAERN